jgi:hypothetical protein
MWDTAQLLAQHTITLYRTQQPLCKAAVAQIDPPMADVKQFLQK